ncbi:hypothetical protein ABES02_29565 [Neobacillus pocheonensis]|uniref:hypothetical protein n=1 Tax=Neobacillus pocheonensis TaxID=363869 RepID=UPI003D2C7FF5
MGVWPFGLNRISGFACRSSPSGDERIAFAGLMSIAACAGKRDAYKVFKGQNIRFSKPS